MKTSALFVLSYAAAVFLGGVSGFFIAHSVPSLTAGVLFGSLIALNGYRMLKGQLKGQQLALVQTIILGSFFVYRFHLTGKVMPAIPMVVLSFALAVLLLVRMPKKQAEKS